MSTDLAVVVGVICAGLAFMSLVSAYSESSPPRMAALLALVSGSLILFAVAKSPQGYSIAGLPEVFVRVFGTLVN